MTDHLVRAVQCYHRASDDEIAAKLQEITASLSDSWDRISRARKIVIKTNMVWPPDRVATFEGRWRELVDPAVMRQVIRLLRSRTDATLTVIDSAVPAPGARPEPALPFQDLLDEEGIDFIDVNYPPFESIEVPGGGLMFARYQLHAAIAEADEVVSVAKMKNHAFMGVTMTTKNLFGLPPIPPHGRTRSYFHHIIRLPYVLADLSMIMRPCLNIVDGLVGQSGREWNGQGRLPNVLLAGNNSIATDSCGTYLMGHDPESDWPTPPFRRDRNHLLVAAEAGYGTTNLDDIAFESDLEPPLAEFDSEETDSPERVRAWRRSTCEQGLYYRDNASRLTDRYGGQYIYLQDGEVVWHGRDPAELGSRRQLSGAKPDSALFLKLADPEEREDERFDVYRQNLEAVRA